MKKRRFIYICLALSLLLNLVLLSLGFIYLRYTGLSISSAISKIPDVVGTVKTTLVDSHSDKLKEIIIEAYPQLETDISDYEKVCILRDWTANVIDYSEYSLLLSVNYPDFNSWSAYTIYQAFQGDLGGLYCSGSAVFLKKVYELFDFDAYYIGVGTTMAMTHSLNLVSINHEDRQLLSVQDAHFNITYEDINSEPIDYFEMLTLLKDKRDSEIRVVEPEVTLTRERFFLGMHDDMNSTFCTDVELVKPGKNEVDNIYKARCAFTLDIMLAGHIDSIESYLQRRNLPPRSIYLFLLPITINGGPNAEQLLEKAQQITGWPPTLD